MSTTVTYKGSTLTTADNNTKTLKTSGKYLEDDITLVDVSSATPSSTNSYQLLGSKEFTTGSTSTSNTKLEDLVVTGAANVFKDSANIIYVRIRDKAGSRNGYFFGSDNYFVNPKATGTQAQTVAMRYIYTYNNDVFGVGPYVGTTGYGVYCQYTGTASTNGMLGIFRRFNSNISLTINGTYTVEVYMLKGPSNKSPFSV